MTHTISIDTEKTEILKNVKKRLTNLYNMLHKYPFSTNLAVHDLEAFIAHSDDMSEDEIINIFEMLDTVFVQFQNIALEQLPKLADYWHRLEPLVAEIIESRKNTVKNWSMAQSQDDILPEMDKIALYENFDWYKKTHQNK